jgi:hypothetical protein
MFILEFAGYLKGFELGHELGFYLGCVEGWLSLIEKFSEQFPQQKYVHLTLQNEFFALFVFGFRIKDALLKVKDLLTDISFNEKMIEQIDEVRAKFKRVSSLMGFQQKYSPALHKTQTLYF